MDIEGYDSALLENLVDYRREELDIEYKSWMPLMEPIHRAKIAKHVCAIANSGGGWIVFGVNDDGSHAEPHPGSLDAYRQDAINNICDKYLWPQLHCSVTNVRSKLTEKLYPVVRVPSHKTVPICAKQNGPLNDKKVSGIVKGLHYIRCAGPKSVPIDDPDLWQSLIHRCVINERQSLLNSISRLFEEPRRVLTPSVTDQIINDIELRWIESQVEGKWAVDPISTRAIFAFHLINSSGNPPNCLNLAQLANAIREASNAADLEVSIGWTFFLQAGRGVHQARVIPFGDQDGYEAVMVTSDGHYASVPTLWRMAPNGCGAEVRLQPEDSRWVIDAVNERRSRSWVAGDRLSPRLQGERILQFVAFVRAFARNFHDVAQAELAVDFKGLKGRMIDDADPGVYYSLDQRSAVDQRRVKVSTGIEELSDDNVTDIAAQLIAPIFRLFDAWEIRSEFIRSLKNS